MRSIDEIYQALKSDFYAYSGYAVADGGDMALRLMAVAAQIFSLEAQCDYAIRQAFPQTASGEHLDCHAQVRALTRREAAKAAGKLCFSCTEPAQTELTVAAGTQCMSASGAVFVTNEEGKIAAGGSSCLVAAQALTAGEHGNVEAGSIVYMRLAPAGVSGVSNPEAFTGGSDAEDDEALRRRVLESYSRLPNGANTAYYEALALSVAGVEKAVVLPRNRGRGTVDIVFSAVGGVPGEELLEKVQQLIEEQREICVDVLVSAPVAKTVDITAGLSLEEGCEFEAVKAKAEAAVKEYFSGQRLGEGIFLARLYSLLMAVEGVENCAITAPAADVAAERATLPVLGQLSIGQAV